VVAGKGGVWLPQGVGRRIVLAQWTAFLRGRAAGMSQGVELGIPFQINVLDAYEDPRELARGGFRAWSAAITMTGRVEYEITEDAAGILDQSDGGGWRHHARTADGRTYTANPIIGLLAPIAVRARSRPQALRRLGWVEPYLGNMRDHDYRVVIPDRPCVLNEGRGSPELWRIARESTQGNCEAAIRFAIHCHADTVPVDLRIATACFWSVWGLADQRLTGEACRGEAEKLLRVALDHFYPHLSEPGALERLWAPELDGLLTNMVMKVTHTYHDLSGIPLRDRVAMRAVDAGAYVQIYENGFYSRFLKAPNLDDWAISAIIYHDIWQINHDETKPDDNLNECSMLLQNGISVRELADYITYMSCSAELPQEAHQATDGWTIITLTSLRHDSRLPERVPAREALWDNENVMKVRKALGAGGDLPALAGPDPALTGADLDLAEVRRLTDPENCRSYTACTQNMAKAVQMWREFVYRYDVIPELLARSKYAQPPGIADGGSRRG
jgi:hypothetical protein